MCNFDFGTAIFYNRYVCTLFRLRLLLNNFRRMTSSLNKVTSTTSFKRRIWRNWEATAHRGVNCSIWRTKMLPPPSLWTRKLTFDISFKGQNCRRNFLPSPGRFGNRLHLQDKFLQPPATARRRVYMHVLEFSPCRIGIYGRGSIYRRQMDDEQD